MRLEFPFGSVAEFVIKFVRDVIDVALVDHPVQGGWFEVEDSDLLGIHGFGLQEYVGKVG